MPYMSITNTKANDVKVTPMPDREFIIGSGEGVFLRLQGIAPKQCEISPFEDRFIVTNFEGLPGTLLNGLPLPPNQPVVWEEVRRLSIGNYELRWSTMDPVKNLKKKHTDEREEKEKRMATRDELDGLRKMVKRMAMRNELDYLCDIIRKLHLIRGDIDVMTFEIGVILDSLDKVAFMSKHNLFLQDIKDLVNSIGIYCYTLRKDIEKWEGKGDDQETR